MKKIITKSKEETQKFAEDLASILLAKLDLASKTSALIIGLYGNLGAGKTTFIQGFAKGLRIKQKIISPTFVILKKFKITKKLQTNSKSKIQKKIKQKTRDANFQNFIHIDAYRLENHGELLNLNWHKLIKNPENIILVEWANKIKKILPKNSLKINFKFINENKREISIFKF